jgi:hypothetical protein
MTSSAVDKNNIGIRSTEALNTASSEGHPTAKKPGLLSKVAANLASALSNSIKFVSNNKLALVSGIVAGSITLNPILGLTVFLAIATGKDLIGTTGIKPPVRQATVEKEIKTEPSAT